MDPSGFMPLAGMPFPMLYPQTQTAGGNQAMAMQLPPGQTAAFFPPEFMAPSAPWVPQTGALVWAWPGKNPYWPAQVPIFILIEMC